MTKVFLDSAYAIALSSPSDQFHKRAEFLAERLETEGAKLITTRVVFLEIGNALAKLSYRSAAIKLLDSLEEDPNVEIIPISEQLCKQALKLYRERPDKEWGMTDCISFIVMQNIGLTDALTTDEHFQQAGFRALLREF